MIAVAAPISLVEVSDATVFFDEFFRGGINTPQRVSFPRSPFATLRMGDCTHMAQNMLHNMLGNLP